MAAVPELQELLFLGQKGCFPLGRVFLSETAVDESTNGHTHKHTTPTVPVPITLCSGSCSSFSAFKWSSTNSELVFQSLFLSSALVAKSVRSLTVPSRLPGSPFLLGLLNPLFPSTLPVPLSFPLPDFLGNHVPFRFIPSLQSRLVLGVSRLPLSFPFCLPRIRSRLILPYAHMPICVHKLMLRRDLSSVADSLVSTQ